MQLDTVLQTVRKAICQELEIEPAALDDRASLRRDYGMDSVAAVNIIFFLEKELDLEIDVRRFATVDSIVDLKRVLKESSDIEATD